MRAMKIPNLAVLALFLGFAFFGLFALPLDAYLWRWLHMVVVLIFGMILNAGGAMGAGDAKFAAAAAPMIAFGDIALLCYILAACILTGYVVHRIAKNSPVRNLVPEWESWSTGKRFPMGLPLGATLIVYLAWPLVVG